MKRKQGFYEKYIKRLLDIILSGMALLVLSPVLLILTIVGAVMLKGNPFFTQLRPGKDEKIFRLVKFCSMTNAKDKDGNLLPDEKRLTKYGKFLRTTSLEGIDIIGQTIEALILQGFRLISPSHAVVNTNWKMVCTLISS